MIDIHRIELPTAFGMGSVNTFLVKEDIPTLIDCGENSEESYAALEKGLAEHGMTLDDIERVIITHAHVDHIGQASVIADRHDIEIWVSDKVEQWAINPSEKWDKRQAAFRAQIKKYIDPAIFEGMYAMLSGFSDNVRKSWLPINEDRIHLFKYENDQLSIGGVNWDTIHAPGHTDTQSVFYQKDTKQLFGADMLLRLAPTPVYEGQDAPIVALLDSYEKFRSMEISKVYPGHYDPFSDHQKKIDNQVKRIHTRKEQCYDLIAAGNDNLLGLFQEMYKGKWSMPAFSMTWGYIDLLRLEERIELEPPTADRASRIRVR